MALPLTPVRFLYRAADVFGDAEAIVCGDKTFSWTDFANRCERLGSALANAGIEAGDRVAFLSLNNHQLLEGYYGVPGAHAVVMPLNVRLSPAELISILNHSGAKILFYETDFAPMTEVFRKECPDILHYVALNEEYEQFLETATPGRLDYESIDENSLAELFYTSGSTGTPKGVMLSHRALYLHALHVSTLYKDTDTMVDLHTIPLFHANGWGRAHTSVMLGIRQVMVRRFDPACVLAIIQQHRATDMCLVPTMANGLLNVPEPERFDRSSMRYIAIGGAASSAELVARMERFFPNARVWAGYGLTETAPVIAWGKPKRGMTFASDEERHRRQAMAGWPVPGIEIRVVDIHMKDVPRDGKSIGEIVTRGDHIMTGYFRDPEATAQAMAGGWFHTGDMAVWDETACIHIVDRKKEIIISGGENISSIEVERAIFAHPDVFECAVVAAPDPKWGEVPAAIVVRKPGTNLTGEALLRFLEGRLGRFKMPRVIEFSDEPLPKTGTGKIRKLVIREKFWAGRARRVGE
jgi:fatty-acyl-CoA synthase